MLRRLERVLDQFEEELRHGGNRRLGGGQICVADINLLWDCTCTACIS